MWCLIAVTMTLVNTVYYVNNMVEINSVKLCNKNIHNNRNILVDMKYINTLGVLYDVSGH